MKIPEMKAALVKNYKKALNKKSKWYASDVSDYKSNLDKISKVRLEELYTNMVAMQSPAFEKFVKREEQKMLNAGMYDLNKK